MRKRFQFGKVDIFMGTTDHWGFAIEYDHNERAFMIDFIHWYIGVEPHWDWKKGEW